MQKIIYGPIYSRRLGRSLGIDLLPYKTCSMNCIYCECGKTTTLTNIRSEFYPLETVMAQLEKAIERDPQLDSITFSGSGEPTLYSRLGELIFQIKNRYPQYKVTVITNSLLLSDRALREELLLADIIIPSLDGATVKSFLKINGIKQEPREIVNAINLLREEFQGEIWLEIFLIKGINTSLEEIENFKNLFATLHVDKIQLNSLDRSPAFDHIPPLSKEEITQIQERLLPFKTEIIARHLLDDEDRIFREKILNLLSHSPHTIFEMEELLELKAAEIGHTLASLLHEKLIGRDARGIYRLL